MDTGKDLHSEIEAQKGFKPKQKDTRQAALFEAPPLPEPWEKDYKQMPEYESNKLVPYKTLVIRFKSLRDWKMFQMVAKMLDYTTDETKSTWWPKPTIRDMAVYRWVEDDEDLDKTIAEADDV